MHRYPADLWGPVTALAQGLQFVSPQRSTARDVFSACTHDQGVSTPTAAHTHTHRASICHPHMHMLTLPACLPACRLMRRRR
jgi:hypothetical protein